MLPISFTKPTIRFTEAEEAFDTGIRMDSTVSVFLNASSISGLFVSIQYKASFSDMFFVPDGKNLLK